MRKLAIVSALFFLICASCNDKASNITLPDDTSVPSLSYPIASFSSVSKFIPFGGTLPTSAQCKGYDIFLTDTNQIIAAACKGIVTSINADAAGNSSITVRYKLNSIYSFLYSGIKNVYVNINDSINPGTLLGKLGTNKELYFAVVKNNNEVLCPKSFGSIGFNTAIDLAVEKHNGTNPTDSVLNSCLFESLPK